ncbi:hypothetical protein MC885_010043, partial [Smutsia gigantea]
ARSVRRAHSERGGSALGRHRYSCWEARKALPSAGTLTELGAHGQPGEAARRQRPKEDPRTPKEREHVGLGEGRRHQPAKAHCGGGTGTAATPQGASAEAAAPATVARAPLTRRSAGPGRPGRRGQRPEVPRRSSLPEKPARRNCLEVPPPGGTPGCWATGAGRAAVLHAPWSRTRVAPASCLGSLPSRPPRCFPPLLASRNPCPWHHLHLSGSHDTLAPTCLKARLHQKRSGPASDVTSTLTDRTSQAMGTYTYTYTSRPRALPCQRRRYRDNLMQPAEEPMRYGNIMYDRRPGQPDPLEIQRQQQARRRALARKRAQEQLRPQTPEPMEGRKHVDVQTELYLEEIADRVIEVDMECQTDAFLDKPPTPLFIPAKTGKDVATQILEGETTEQALLEVMEEEELANLKASQHAYEELRNVELAEVQRLEEQERRHREEKERRKQQQWQVVRKHKETAEKIAARAFAQRYLADLLPSVFGSLRDGGYFYDPIERDIEIGFLPWLMNEVDKTMEYSMVGRTVLDMLIREVVEKRLTMYDQKEDKHPSLKPGDRLGGPGATREPFLGNDFPEQGVSQSQRPVPGRDFLQGTPSDGRYMGNVSSPERKLMEEGEEEPTEMRKSFGREEMSQQRGPLEP